MGAGDESVAGSGFLIWWSLKASARVQQKPGHTASKDQQMQVADSLPWRMENLLTKKTGACLIILNKTNKGQN